MVQAKHLQRILITLGIGGFTIYILLHSLTIFSIGGVYIFTPDFLFGLGPLGFLTLTFGLLIAIFRMPGWSRLVPLLGLLAGLPVFLVVAIISELLSFHPSERDRLILPNGDLIMLGYRPGPPEPTLTVWRSVGLGWQRLGDPIDLTHLRFEGKTSLALSDDGNHLLIRKGDRHLACLKVSDNFKRCW